MQKYRYANRASASPQYKEPKEFDDTYRKALSAYNGCRQHGGITKYGRRTFTFAAAFPPIPPSPVFNPPVYHGADWDTVTRNCGSWKAHGCTVSNARGWCNCKCDDEGSYRAEVKLYMSPVVWARNDDPAAPLSQILYEEAKHVKVDLVHFKWAIQRGERLEARLFSTKRECDAACREYLNVTKEDFFDDWVHKNSPHPF